MAKNLTTEADKEFIGRMYEQYYDDAVRYARSLTDNVDDAQQLVQDTFVTLLEKGVGELREQDKSKAYLMTCVRNRFLNEYKKTHRDGASREILVDAVYDAVEEERFSAVLREDETIDPALAYEHSELKEEIERCLSQLPDEQREVIYLKSILQMKEKEIAQLQGVALATVKSRIRYAKDKLCDLILDREKQTGVKLHSVAPLLPLLRCLYAGETFSKMEFSHLCTAASGAAGGTAAAETVVYGGAGSATGMTSAASTAAVSGTTATVGTAGAAATAGTAGAAAAATATATAASTAAAVVGMGITAKVLIGVAVAAVVGGTALAPKVLGSHDLQRADVPAAQYEEVSETSDETQKPQIEYDIYLPAEEMPDQNIAVDAPDGKETVAFIRQKQQEYEALAPFTILESEYDTGEPSEDGTEYYYTGSAKEFRNRDGQKKEMKYSVDGELEYEIVYVSMGWSEDNMWCFDTYETLYHGDTLSVSATLVFDHNESNEDESIWYDTVYYETDGIFYIETAGSNTSTGFDYFGMKYGFDPDGALTTVTVKEYKAVLSSIYGSGNPRRYLDREFVYDASGKLMEIRQYQDDILRYRYDSSGRMIYDAELEG